MTYASVALAVPRSAGVLVGETLSSAPSLAGGARITVLGFRGTRGVHLAAWGIALTVLAAPTG